MAISNYEAREQYLERPLPSSIDSEKAILGGIFLNNSYLGQTLEVLDPGDFYLKFHRDVYSAMLALYERGLQIDPILVNEELKKINAFESSGGVVAITNLTFGLPHFSESTLANYCKVVQDKSASRKLISACNQIISDALSEEEETAYLLDRAEQKIFELVEGRSREGLVHVKPVAVKVLENVQEFARRETHALTGLATGFRDFDSMTSGLQKTDLVIIAARPSMGKTALCLTLAQNAAILENAVVGIFSLEMSKEQLVMRMLSSEAKVDAHRFRNGFLTSDEWGRLGTAINTLSDTKIFINDAPGISVLEMRAKARRLAAEQKKLDLIIVDYLQLMSGGGARRMESRQQEVALISRELKALAKDLDVPVVALSQLSRAPEARTDHRPQLADLRESGSIEQDADLVAFIYREEQYNPSEENVGMAELIIAKQRNGPTGTVRMAFIKEFTRFESIWQG
jgi:replicative DNA helicase